MKRRNFLKTAIAAATGGALLPTHAMRAALPAVGDLGAFEVIVCGGGPAGMAAATLAARQGAKVLLVERYGRLGGMAVHGLVGPLMGKSESPFVGEVLKRIGGTATDPDWLDLHYADLAQEAGARLLVHAWVSGVSVDGRRVTGVRLLTKQGFLHARAAVVVDATGDGDVAALAGAEFEYGRPGDQLVQPASIMFRLGGVEPKALMCGSEEQARKVRTPAGTWHEVVTAAQAQGELGPTIGVVRLYRAHRPTERFVNATQINNINGLDPHDLTRAELAGRRQAQQVLAFLQKHGPGYADAYIVAMPAVIGVRETRRVLGVQYLSRQDVLSGKKWPDAVVRAASFPVDIHNPAGAGQAEGFAARVKPYDIPYGCLVPREVDGLLLAGRCISGSHDAHASYRVQCIAMAIGAAAGAAAALSAQRGLQPRTLAVASLQKVLFV
jgi:hypothetical protein